MTVRFGSPLKALRVCACASGPSLIYEFAFDGCALLRSTWRARRSLIQSRKCRIGALGFVTHGYRRDAMKIPDYIAIGVLIVVLVWAVADQFPRGKL